MTIDLTINDDMFSDDLAPLIGEIVNGLAGNDKITLHFGSQEDTINGGEGDDTIFVSSFHIIINGDSGADNITSGLGSTVYGGDGDDTIHSISNLDELQSTVHGGAGNDLVLVDDPDQGDWVTVFGDEGNDNIVVKGSGYKLHGGSGDDVIFGSGTVRYENTIDGGDGYDHISVQNDLAIDYTNVSGGLGDDVFALTGYFQKIYGSSGDDLIYTGSELLYADPATIDASLIQTNTWVFHCSIESGIGNDRIKGNFGEGTIDGGEGTDVIDIIADRADVFGGAGNDTIRIDGMSSQVSVAGDSGDDLLIVTPDTTGQSTQDFTLSGGLGNDTFVIRAPNKTLC